MVGSAVADVLAVGGDVRNGADAVFALDGHAGPSGVQAGPPVGGDVVQTGLDLKGGPRLHQHPHKLIGGDGLDIVDPLVFRVAVVQLVTVLLIHLVSAAAGDCRQALVPDLPVPDQKRVLAVAQLDGRLLPGDALQDLLLCEVYDLAGVDVEDAGGEQHLKPGLEGPLDKPVVLHHQLVGVEFDLVLLCQLFGRLVDPHIKVAAKLGLARLASSKVLPKSRGCHCALLLKSSSGR